MLALPLKFIDLKENFSQELKIRLSPRFLAYSPNVKINIETSRYILKTADSLSELISAFTLRYNIFHEDLPEFQEDQIDVDIFDSTCDHIIIIDKNTNQVCGTYRAICSLFSDHYYNESEFEIRDFLNTNDGKLELGRACISRLHRNGQVIDLLWRGIAEYVKHTDSRYLFGCSSISTINRDLVQDIYTAIKHENYYGEDFKIRPLNTHFLDLNENSKLNPKFDLKNNIPPLLRSYISAGAKVYGQPAIDLELYCIDFFTICDLQNLTSGFRKRYFGIQ